MRDSRHDAYIAKAPDFAQPLLTKIRAAFHKASPEIQETIKWSRPFFDLDGIVGGMAAFKQHVTLVYWRGSEIDDPDGVLDLGEKTEMASLRIESAKDLPTQKVMVAFAKQVIALNRAKKAAPKAKAAAGGAKRPAVKVPAVPTDMKQALAANAAAQATFKAFSPSNKRDYVEWILEAKREATREKRLAQAIEWMAEGKARHWKYAKGC